MSVEIPRHLVDKEKEDQIKKMLSFSPITQTYGNHVKFEAPKADSVIQAWKVHDDPFGMVTIRLPFQYARIFFSKTNCDRYFIPANFTMNNVVLRPHQEEAISRAKAYLNAHRTVLLEMVMGSGKTVMSIYLSMQTGHKTVVLTPTVDLSKQWANEIRDKTTAKVWVVGEESYCSNWDIATCYYHQSRWESIRTDLRACVGTLVIDESHMFNNETGINAVLAFNPMYVIACTATPTRSRDQMDRIMKTVVGNYVVKIKNTIKLDIVKLDTGVTATRTQGHKGVNFDTLRKSLLYNDFRNNQIYHLAKCLVYYGIKSLIISREKAHVKLLASEIQKFYPDCDYICEGKSDYRDSLVTVGILEMCGTGFDEANACKNWNGERIRCVVLAASIGNIETTKQATGRSFRHKNPILIYPVDKDSNIRKHYGLINEWKKTGEIKPTFHNIVPEKITETICELSKNNGR